MNKDIVAPQSRCGIGIIQLNTCMQLESLWTIAREKHFRILLNKNFYRLDIFVQQA